MFFGFVSSVLYKMERLEFTEDKITAGLFYKHLPSIHNDETGKFAVSTYVDLAETNFDEDFYCVNEKVVSKIFTKLCSVLKAKWSDIKMIMVFFKKGFVTSQDVSFAILVTALDSQISQSGVQFLANNFKSSELAWKQKADFLMDFNFESTLFDCEFDSSVESLFPEEPEEIKLFEDVKNSIPPHLVQIQASKEEVLRRINQFVDGKRELIDKSNESLHSLPDGQISCSRVSPVKIRSRNIIGCDNKLLSRSISDGKQA